MPDDAAHETRRVDQASSPWPVPPVEGLPFDKNSDEARAIERVIEHAEKQDSTASERDGER